MRVLLSFENFAGFGGTETYTLALARELERLDHDVSIYSPNRGQMAEFAQQQGIRVFGAAELPPACDLVVACDAATCHELARRYLGALKVMVVHSADHMLQAPPGLADSCDGLVVLNDRVARSVAARAWHAPILRLRQPIELWRFWDLGSVRAAPRNVLVVTNYVEGARSQIIETACRARGLTVRWLGATTGASASPEAQIADADIVIGLGRSALEAMAAGRATYVYGVVGGDGWVTADTYEAMEADGFAGTAFPDVQLDAERITADLGRWDPHLGEYGRDLASAHHSSREHAIDLIEYACRQTTATSSPVAPGDELAHLVRLQWQHDVRANASNRAAEAVRHELTVLEARNAELEHRLDDTHAELLATQGRLQSLRQTRRYRLANRLALPADRLRAHLRPSGR
jgi:hypothetical protein